MRNRQEAGLRCALRSGVLILLGFCALLQPLASLAEQPPRPTLRIPLNKLGFPGHSLALVHAGASMVTVHLMDPTHLLFTYSLRSLVPRLPGDDARDLDRLVAAELVEIPTGKVLAQTVWHMHDHGRYLWSLGGGVFVVRIGDNLSMLAPLQALQAGSDPFRRYALPHRPGEPVLVYGSPDSRVFTIEVATGRREEETGEGMTAHPRHYTLEFFRKEAPAEAGGPQQVSAAGLVGSPVLLQLAMDGDGYLWAEDGQRGRWMLSFNEFGGKQEKLAPVMSSCHPRLTLLSRSQFLVESCRGSDLSPVLAAYGFDGHENWEEPLSESLQPLTLALAPAAGRFAMSRLSSVADGSPVAGTGTTESTAQEIRVYQTESGDLITRVQSSPPIRSAENFDLSEDGRTLAVLGPETLDLYSLPALSEKDRKDLAEVQEMMPPRGEGPVALARITHPIAAPLPVDGGETVHAADEAPSLSAAAGSNGAAAGAPSGGAASTSSMLSRSEKAQGADRAEAAAHAEGDAPAPAEGHRKPPTLLAPGEKAEISPKAKPEQ